MSQTDDQGVVPGTDVPPISLNNRFDLGCC